MDVRTVTPTDGGALQLRMEVWHPDCWVLETSRKTDVGLLSYGCYSNDDRVTSSVFTLYAETTATIDDAIEVIAGADAVYDVAVMVRDHRGHVPSPGNATRELLVDHDGGTQISDAFTDRGFIPAEPIDTRANTERWTVLTHRSRDEVGDLLDEVRAAEDATIDVTSVATTPGVETGVPLPVDRLSSRQREVFRLARRKGYYDHPRRTDAGELAAELGISTSTVHEHLRKVEATLLGE